MSARSELDAILIEFGNAVEADVQQGKPWRRRHRALAKSKLKKLAERLGGTQPANAGAYNVWQKILARWRRL